MCKCAKVSAIFISTDRGVVHVPTDLTFQSNGGTGRIRFLVSLAPLPWLWFSVVPWGMSPPVAWGEQGKTELKLKKWLGRDSNPRPKKKSFKRNGVYIPVYKTRNTALSPLVCGASWKQLLLWSCVPTHVGFTCYTHIVLSMAALPKIYPRVGMHYPGERQTCKNPLPHWEELATCMGLCTVHENTLRDHVYILQLTLTEPAFILSKFIWW